MTGSRTGGRRRPGCQPARWLVPVLARVAVIALLLAGGGPAAGQDGPTPADTLATRSPRIGLVLSGGGARGAAHIGVLRVLEEYHVPVHAIVGTSMGAIVGGLFAAGMGPAEMEAEIAALDWTDMLTDRLPRRYLSFRRLEEDREFLTPLELPVGGRGPRLPAGVLAGRRVEARLAALMLPVSGIRDFNRLPVPFRATATDLETGELIVLRDGQLHQAVRASMSIPAMFGPVELDGRILVDGGVARNLPVDVARELGVDVLIAVDVGTPLSEHEGLTSILDVTRQLTNIVTQANTAVQRDALTDSDVLIAPNLRGLGVMDYHRWRDALAAGDSAARAVEGRLRALAVSPDQYAALSAGQRQRFREPVTVDSVRLVHDGRVPENVVRRLIEVRPDQPLDPGELEADLLRLHGLRLFDRVHTRIDSAGDMATLVVELEPRAAGPNSLRFGMLLEDDLGAGMSSFSVLATLWLRQLNRYGGEARLDVQAGEPRRGHLELFQPVWPASPLFVAGSATHQEGEGYGLPEPADASLVHRRTESEMAFNIGAHPGRGMEMRAGLSRRSIRPDDPGPGPGHLAGTDVGYGAALTLDYMDDAVFPRRGGLARFSWAGYRTGLGGDASYDRYDAAVAYAIPLGRQTVVFGGEAATRSGQVPAYDPYVLGGPFRLTGRPRGSVAGTRGGLARVTWLHDLAGGRVQAGLSLEAGAAWHRGERLRREGVVPAGSVLVGVRTLVGPLYAIAGHAEGGSPTVYIAVGRRIASPW